MITTVSLKDALLESVKEVFETMAFMAVEETEQTWPSSDESFLLGTITFKGPLEGCLGICCGPNCARTIAASMLGLGPDDKLGDSDISDAIGEIANMVLGAVKARIQNEAGTIEVSIPSVVQGRELRNSLGDSSECVRTRVSIEEEHLAELSLLYREAKVV